MRILLRTIFLVGFIAAGLGTASAGVLISIDKMGQRMTVTVDGKQRYVWPVSTGRFGYGTPSGSYRPFRMEVDHFSREWDDAPMPHSIFFTPRGHAIHGTMYTRSLGSAVSHGCVRLSPGNAATLFALVRAQGMGNTRVVVTGFGSGVPKLVAPDIRKVKSRLSTLPKPQFGSWLNEKLGRPR